MAFKLDIIYLSPASHCLFFKLKDRFRFTTNNTKIR
jgi:hypothetical protein